MSPVEIVVALMMVVGVLGIVIPILPGLLVIIAGTLVWALDERSVLAWGLFALSALIYLLGLALQFLIPGKRMKAAGVRTSTLVFGVVVAIVMAFVIPVVGLFVGFPLGIFVLSLARTRDRREAWVATKHALRAVGTTIVIELLTAFTIIAMFMTTIIFLDRT